MCRRSNTGAVWKTTVEEILTEEKCGTNRLSRAYMHISPWTEMSSDLVYIDQILIGHAAEALCRVTRIRNPVKSCGLWKLVTRKLVTALAFKRPVNREGYGLVCHGICTSSQAHWVISGRSNAITNQYTFYNSSSSSFSKKKKKERKEKKWPSQLYALSPNTDMGNPKTGQRPQSPIKQ